MSFLLALGAAAGGEATPLSYTFAGTIVSPYAYAGWNGPGSKASGWDALKRNQTISFTLVIDVDTWMTSGVELVDYNDEFFVYPAADQIVTSAIESYGSTTKGFVVSTSEYNWTKFGWTGAAAVSGPATDFDWELGTTLTGTSWKQGEYLGYDFRATLSEIAAVAVPEPATGLLLLAGVLGLAAARRRRKGSVRL